MNELATNLATNLATDLARSQGALTPSDLSSVREWWIADDGVAVVSGTPDQASAWIGRKQGWAMAAPGAGQRPNYTADGANFGGHPVLQNSESEERYLLYEPGGNVIETTARLTLLAYIRRRAIPTANARVFTCESATLPFHLIQALTTGDMRSYVDSSTDPPDLINIVAPSTVGWYRSAYDGASHKWLVPGQTEGSSAYTGDYGAAMTRVGTGIPGSAADVSYGALFICDSPLSADDDLAIRTFVEARLS